MAATKLLIKRSGNSSGVVQVLVRTSDQGNAKPGLHYVPIDKRNSFLDGEEQMALDFEWRPENFSPGVFSICFELSVLTGRAIPGTNAVAQLIIENPVGKSRPGR